MSLQKPLDEGVRVRGLLPRQGRVNPQNIVVISLIPDLLGQLQAFVLGHKGGSRCAPSCGIGVPEIWLCRTKPPRPQRLYLPTAVKDEAKQGFLIEGALLAGQENL